MFITGISDEAGKDLSLQIKAHQELGWSRMEIRDVAIAGNPAANLHDIPDASFELFEREIRDSGLEIYCLSSRIANWSKQVDDPFDISLEEARRAISRMERLGTRFIRIMSYAVRKGEDQMLDERFRRLRQLTNMFRDAGISVLHENCMNYGGLGWPFTLELLDKVPGLKLVFDTGNPVVSDDLGKPAPWPKQSAWEFYEHVRDHIAYIHIKDAIWDAENAKVHFCFPGEGHADVERIVSDLVSCGYEGGLSIEPHLGAVIPDPSAKDPQTASAYATYVEYGRRLEKIVSDAMAPIALPENG